MSADTNRESKMNPRHFFAEVKRRNVYKVVCAERECREFEEVKSNNFFAELKRRNVYKVAIIFTDR